MDAQRDDEWFATKAESSSITNFAVRTDKLHTVPSGALRHVVWSGNKVPDSGPALGGDAGAAMPPTSATVAKAAASKP